MEKFEHRQLHAENFTSDTKSDRIKRILHQRNMRLHRIRVPVNNSSLPLIVGAVLFPDAKSPDLKVVNISAGSQVIKRNFTLSITSGDTHIPLIAFMTMNFKLNGALMSGC